MAQRLYVLHFILRSYGDRKNQIIRYRGGQKARFEFFDLHGDLGSAFLPPIPPKKGYHGQSLLHFCLIYVIILKWMAMKATGFR